jgi:hypothetical protein
MKANRPVIVDTYFLDPRIPAKTQGAKSRFAVVGGGKRAIASLTSPRCDNRLRWPDTQLARLDVR